jgi:hypothetical protein
VKRLNHKYFGVRVFIGRGGVGTVMEQRFVGREAFCGVSCIARPVGYPHLYNYVVSHEYQTFIFLVSFGVVACAWRREERTLSESARQPNVRQIGSSNKSFDMEPGAIGRSKSRYDRYGPIQWAKFGKVFGEAGFDGGSQTEWS